MFSKKFDKDANVKIIGRCEFNIYLCSNLHMKMSARISHIIKYSLISNFFWIMSNCFLKHTRSFFDLSLNLNSQRNWSLALRNHHHQPHHYQCQYHLLSVFFFFVKKFLINSCSIGFYSSQFSHHFIFKEENFIFENILMPSIF